MKPQYPSPLVIFPDEALKTIESNIGEFYTWLILHTLLNRNDFKEGTIDSIIQYYTPINNINSFLELQFKFFLLRISQNTIINQNRFTELTEIWLSGIDRKLPMNKIEMGLGMIAQTSLMKSRYGKYFYSYSTFKDYIERWNICTVDLKTWKRFKFLSMPADFSFAQPLFKEQGGLSFPKSHMRKLFDEYVEEVYKEKFKPRLSNTLLAEKEKSVMDRVLQNVGSSDDKKYLNNLFINFFHWRTISENLSKCLADTVSLSELDINSQFSFANYFALIKYYEALNDKPKKTNTKPALWFKNLPSDINKKREVFGILESVYYRVKVNCPTSTWSDFRSVFNKNGSTTKIEWPGDAEVLNFIFRKLHRILSFKGNKWEVIDHYFYRADKNDKTLTAEKLPGNSHYKESDDEKLTKYLNSIISTLSN